MAVSSLLIPVSAGLLLFQTGDRQAGHRIAPSARGAAARVPATYGEL